MNLRSGETTEKKITVKPKSQKKSRQQRKNMAAGEQPAETDMQTLMMAIKSEITAFQDFNRNAEETKQEIGKLTREIKGMQEEIKDTKKEVLDAQHRISNLEDKEPTLKEIISHLLIKQSRMAERLDYLENKSRQNNIRIYQVKEGAEGADMVKFIEELISGKLGIHESELFIVAAHRSALQTTGIGNTPRQEKPENVKPRSIIVRFLTWQTKQRVLDAAWDKKRTPIKFAEENIYFDQDYSSEIMKKRRQFTEIRKRLKESGIKSHFKYPAKLKVKIGDGEQMYNTVTEAYAALQAQGVLGEQEAQSRAHAGRTETRRKGKEKLDEKTEALLEKLNGKY